ncbi:hypothetical protein HCN44_007362 [Aphidius gifuensis]|uniref:Uncharacterized protein n=1 Tax=Aphidius gifuensis TaxID=684658 RepID=A0A834XLG5_APHGI|nr:hypothetical protein HCN44_007362 [Aphidius gifuensis]
MPELSRTGLISARIHPINKPKPKKIELSGTTKPAPFILRPFAGLFNPFPYGCSVLCNHPADGEAKEFVKRAKESWANEGKALLLPDEMELIRATLIAGGTIKTPIKNDNINIEIKTTTTTTAATTTMTTTVPEELFRKYTETDSRPLTPTPTLASGLGTSNIDNHDEHKMITNLQQDNDTLSWHTLTLEPQPINKKNIDIFKNIYQRSSCEPPPPSPIAIHINDDEILKNNDDSVDVDDDDDHDSESSNELQIKRRGKKLKKRKYRRGSAYGQQTEVRDLIEPAETQVSQVDDLSRRNSTLVTIGNTENNIEHEKTTIPLIENPYLSSFLSPELLQHLSRELDRETVEKEFSLRKRIALEEALRIKGEIKLTKQLSTLPTNAPRIYSRKNARFELLDSRSLISLTSLDYLGKYVYLKSERKKIFSKTFNKYYDDTIDDKRLIQPNNLMTALEDVIGVFTNEQRIKFINYIGEINSPINYRTWCGICAACERILLKLPSRVVDPPSWIELADFQALERRIKNIKIDDKLILLLREIRDR